MKFGDYIRQKREQKSWTQPEAAARADIEQSYLSKLETGKSYPSEDIFNRLVKAYEIDTTEMGKQIFSAELDKLREIKEVRTVVLERQNSDRTFVRSWMIAGLAFLMIGGASLGFALLSDTNQQQFLYRSQGVILPGENLWAFDIIDGGISDDGSPEFQKKKQELLDQQKAMVSRLDQKDEIALTYRGESFVEDVPEGKRFYQVVDAYEISNASPFRWFLVPALMFLVGSLGCFFISFRWKSQK